MKKQSITLFRTVKVQITTSSPNLFGCPKSVDYDRDCRKTLKHTISCLSNICNLLNFNDTKMAEMLLFDFSDSLIRSQNFRGFLKKEDFCEGLDL